MEVSSGETCKTPVSMAVQISRMLDSEDLQEAHWRNVAALQHQICGTQVSKLKEGNHIKIISSVV